MSEREDVKDESAFAGELPGEVVVVSREYAEELAKELDTARALLASRTADLARVLSMDDPERVTWARALGYAGGVAHVAEQHFGMPVEPGNDGTYRDPRPQAT